MGCTSAHDNAVAESFFASLAKDLLRRQSFRTRAEARTGVFDYIETFYNPVRLHSTLDYASPIDYAAVAAWEWTGDRRAPPIRLP